MSTTYSARVDCGLSRQRGLLRLTADVREWAILEYYKNRDCTNDQQWRADPWSPSMGRVCFVMSKGRNYPTCTEGGFSRAIMQGSPAKASHMRL